MQRYLRQPLACLSAIVGRTTAGRTSTGEAIVVDALGDCFASGGYHALDDTLWIMFHNSIRDCYIQCAKSAGVDARAEQGGNKDTGSAKRPGDAELRGSHGYRRAGTNWVWNDIVIASATCPSHRAAAAAVEGGAAQRAADAKHVKHDPDIPSHVTFVPLAAEADGFLSPVFATLLRGFAKKRADRDSADDCAMGAWLNFYLQAIAVTHARNLARCILIRADDTLTHLGMASARRSASAVDAESLLMWVVPSSQHEAQAGPPAAKRRKRGPARAPMATRC